MKYALFTAIFGAIALLALRALAIRYEWLDQPDARKAHCSAVPAVGGLAWILAFFAGMALSGLLFQLPWLMLGVGIICILGAVDDRIPLPSVLRLLVQALAVVVDGDAHDVGAHATKEALAPMQHPCRLDELCQQA